MPREDDPTYLECAAVRLGTDGAAEMDRSRRHIWIPREQIVRLELSFGSAAERPSISLVLGILLVLLALLGPAIVILALLRNAMVHTKLVTTLGFIVPASSPLAARLPAAPFGRVSAFLFSTGPTSW